MLNKNTFSKILVFITTTLLGFSTSNAAVGDSTNLILSKQDCYERICEWTNIGIGGAYYNTNGESADIGGYAGYISLFGKAALKQRLQLGANITLGGGKSDLSGTSPMGAKNNTNLMIFDFDLKFGINIASKESPIFINLLGGLDVYSTNKDEKKFRRSLGLAGIEIEGEKPISTKLSVMYGASYSFIVAGNYLFNNKDTRAQIPFSMKNYAISANIGLWYEIERGISTYARLVGKYQNIGASEKINSGFMPATQNYVAMVEFGIGF